MADWALPALASTYINTLAEIKNRDIDLALQFDGTSSASIPTGAIRWSSSANTWLRWTGSTWGALSSLFAFPAIQVDWDSRLISNYDNTYRQGFRFGGDRVLRIFATTGDGVGGAIDLCTRNGPGSSDTDYGTRRVRIDSSGQVGLGVIPTCSIDSALGGMFQHGSNAGNNLVQTYTNGGAVGMGMWAGGSTRLYSTGSLTFAVNANIGTGTPTGFLDAVTVASSGKVGLLNASPVVSLDIGATDAIRVPAGTNAQRPPTGSAGMLRYNSSLGLFEGFATAWATFAPTASPTFTGTVTIPAGASIAGFAPLASPTFTGTPAAPTAAAGASTAQLATTAFVQGELASRHRFLQAAAVATTSGTAIDFTSIPSWAKKLTVILRRVSTSGSSLLQIQLGSSSGGVETTGYVSSAQTSDYVTSSTSGFLAVNAVNVPAMSLSGTMTIVNISNNLWVQSGTFANSTTGNTCATGGDKPLSNTLDRVRITTGTDTFVAGSIGLLIEG